MGEEIQLEPFDPVTFPMHYNTGKIGVLDFIIDQDFGYLDGQVVKYISRYRWKGAPEIDLRKAKFYLERLIIEEEKAAKAQHGEVE